MTNIIKSITPDKAGALTKKKRINYCSSGDKSWKHLLENSSMLVVLGFLSKYMTMKEKNKVLSAKRLWERVKGDKTLRVLCKECNAVGVDPKDLFDGFLEITKNLTCVKYPLYLNLDNVSYLFDKIVEKDGSITLFFDVARVAKRSFKFGYKVEDMKGGV